MADAPQEAQRLERAVADPAQETQRKKAEEHMKEAKKAIGTSWWSFKCRSDFVTASVEYNNAAACFKNAKMFPESIEAWRKAANLQELQFDHWSAGRAYSAAAALCVDGPGGHEAAAENYQEAFRCFRFASKPDIAAKTQIKLAELYEKHDATDLAKKAWLDAVSTLQDDDVANAELSETYKHYIGFLVRRSLIEDAIVATDGHIEILKNQGHFSFVHKEILAKVVLVLHGNQDTVRAQEVIDSSNAIDGWLMSREAKVGCDLVDTFRNCDAEACEKLVKDQIFSFLQLEVARTARQLRVPVVTIVAPVVGGNENDETQETATADAQNLGALLM